MVQLLNWFLVNNLILLWIPCETQYAEGTNTKMIAKLLQMAKEVVIDTVSKIESVQHFQNSLYKSTAFQMGNIVYRIRAKYKRMVFLYERVLNRIEQKIELYNIIELSEMDDLVHEIDNLIRMIEMWEENRGRYSSNTRMAALRTYGEVKMWQGLAESENNDQSTMPPSDVNNNTGSRRKNGKWHYIPDEFDK